MSPFPAEPINMASSGSVSGTWTPPVDATGSLGGNETSGLTEAVPSRLAWAIHQALDSHGEGLCRGMGQDDSDCYRVARAILASDWLAARTVEAEQRVRAEIVGGVRKWCAVNEVATPPLDWAGLGEFLARVEGGEGS